MPDAYDVVRQFERGLSEYTGAPEVVTTNSCTMAIWIALAWCFEKLSPFGWPTNIHLPRRTYCSVPMTVQFLGAYVHWDDRDWIGEYQLEPYPLWDSARRFTSGMYRPGQMQCVSFQTSKILGLEQGGAVLLDDPEAARWLRRARFDGREGREVVQLGWHCYLNPSTAALGLSRLACLPEHNPPQEVSFPDISGLPIWKS